MSRNTTTTLIKECQQLGLIKQIAKGYELTTDCFINHLGNNTDARIYKAICDFCKSKGVNPPNRDERAMSVLLTKYNIADLPDTEPISITYQLRKRCRNLPEKVSLSYFIKTLGKHEQYRAMLEREQQAEQYKKDFNGFAF